MYLSQNTLQTGLRAAHVVVGQTFDRSALSCHSRQLVIQNTAQLALFIEKLANFDASDISS